MVARAAIREMRKEGIKVGFVKVRRFRPFPDEELRQALKKYRAIGVIDDNYSFGAPNYGGILYQEVRSALYDLDDGPAVINFLAGLGGREVTVEYMRKMFNIVLNASKTGKVEQPVYWIGLRE